MLLVSALGAISCMFQVFKLQKSSSAHKARGDVFKSPAMLYYTGFTFFEGLSFAGIVTLYPMPLIVTAGGLTLGLTGSLSLIGAVAPSEKVAESGRRPSGAAG